MTDDLVTVECSETVAIVTLSAPDQRNALTAGLADDLRAAMAGIESTTVRCVLLRGAGDAFAAGGDLDAHALRARGDIDEDAYTDRLDRVADAVAAVYDCPVPTVAAVDGVAFSEGACLALACDIRLASTEATVGFGFRRLGQSPTAGATFLLSAVAGPDVAADLLYTGRLVDAHTAAEMGLFTRVVPGDAFEDALARVLAAISTAPPTVLQATKRLLGSEYDRLEDATAAEQRAAGTLSETDTFEEGVDAALSGRDPEF